MKALRLKTHHFHTKLLYQKSLLRQIEWSVQNGPITENGVWSVTTHFYFSLRTSYKEMIWCTNDPNAHIHIFCKRWSFIWRCFFPVSIVKRILKWRKTLLISLVNTKCIKRCITACGWPDKFLSDCLNYNSL